MYKVKGTIWPKLCVGFLLSNLLWGCATTNEPLVYTACSTLPAYTEASDQVHWVQSGSPNLIAALDFSPDDKRLTIAYTGTAESRAGIVELEIDSQRITHVTEVEWIHPQYTMISQDGAVVVTLEEREDFVNEKRQNFPELMQPSVHNIIEARNVSSGQLISMIPSELSQTDFDLSSDGELLTQSEDGGVSLTPVYSDYGAGGTGLLLFEEYGVIKVNTVAFSADNTAYYYVHEDGSVNRQRFDKETLELTNTRFHILGAPFSVGNRLARLGRKGAGESLDLVVSTNAKRLAILKSESIEVWNIRGALLQSQAVYTGSFGPEDKILISPNGNLLSVITKGKWQLFNANNFDILMTGETALPATSKVSAQAFSDDSCYLAIGLDNGEIGLVSLYAVLETK